MNPNVLFLLQWLGALSLLIAVFQLVRWFWQYAWLPLQSQTTRLAQRYGAGSWALITGASDGLGKSFAQQLASHGFNLVLVARTQSKLDRLQAELQAQGVQVRNPAFDVTPAELVTALITEKGVVYQPNADNVARLFAN